MNHCLLQEDGMLEGQTWPGMAYGMSRENSVEVSVQRRLTSRSP